MTKALMIQGTGSGVGKSIIVAGLCRIFKDIGVNVAPFKAQNMALNSFITREGGEIGRAQALQAEAARIEAANDMNPILLKASGDMGSQVIIHGRVHSTMKARQYYGFKKTAWEAVKESYARLAEKYELIIMEGAGSPAEINLMAVDIVNMSVAKHAKAPVILVGDIDKGGVFASIYGTVKLLGKDSRHIKGFVINKFRGDIEILKPGLDMIKDKTGRPVIGVLPYIKGIGLPEEDGLALSRKSNLKALSPASHLGRQSSNSGKVKIVVVRLQYISNFTDFDPFLYEPDVELLYSDNPSDIENADVVIIPGTKNTVKDLMFLKERRLDESIKRAFSKGIQIVGMCGGYQMLGKKIYDPYKVESPHKKVDGLGLLNIETTLERTKTTCHVEAVIQSTERRTQNAENPVSGLRDLGSVLRGYEIHMGSSTGDIGLFKINRLSHLSIHPFTHTTILDGSSKKNCWGTYIHGIFDNDRFRRGIINSLRVQKGLRPEKSMTDYAQLKDSAVNNLAKILKENLDMEFIRSLVNG